MTDIKQGKILCQNPSLPTLNASHFSLVVQFRRPDTGIFCKMCIDIYKTCIKKYKLTLEERFIWLQTTCKNQFRIKILKCCHMPQWESLHRRKICISVNTLCANLMHWCNLVQIGEFYCDPHPLSSHTGYERKLSFKRYGTLFYSLNDHPFFK